MKAVGIHVFAGGFTMGVKEVTPVECQLEVHGFGMETAEQVAKVPVINCEAKKWPIMKGEFAYGNPRCTGFSTITSGYDANTHGAFAKQTCDIQELCEYSAGKFDIVVWESVQQAYTTGRPLLDWAIKTHFAPKHYRIAHVFINAASFGNAQQRKRYFFVAYRDDRNFNIVPPTISPWKPVMYDAIWKLRHRKTNEMPSKTEYDFDSYVKLTPNEKLCLPELPNGWGLNMMGRFLIDKMPPDFQKIWRLRASDMPFSLHCLNRVNWCTPSPTLHSSANRMVHPEHDRPLTVGEIATIMGWPGIPIGAAPVPQIAKGIVPAVGKWLAEQAQLYLNNHWGKEDWESSYDAINSEWKGGDANGALEKTFDLTTYSGHQYDIERYGVDVIQSHKLPMVRPSRSADRETNHRVA